jgi:uncharacterized membrane protein
MATVVVLQSIPIPPIGGFSISLVLIPIVLGGAVYGPGAGALLGTTFGVIVYINCVTGVDGGGAMVFQADPILCLLVVLTKGIMAGWLSALTYKALKAKSSMLAMACAAVVCPVVNTGIFVGCMLTFFTDVLSAWAGGGEIIAYVLSGLLLANFVPELLINVIFSPAGIRIAEIVRK